MLSCFMQGAECITPLARGARPDITSLEAAMDPALDDYFEKLPKFKWDVCKMYYDAENEVSTLCHC